MKPYFKATLQCYSSLTHVLKLVFFIMFFYLLSGVFSSESTESKYQVTVVEPEVLSERIQRTGILAFRRTLNMSFKSRGFLQKLQVDEGDLFLKNQLLAALDLTELKAVKNSTYAQLKQAKNDVQRIKTLLDKNLSSQQQLEQMKTNVHTSRAAYKIAYYNLEKAEMRSPFTGVVLKRYAELGQLLSPENSVLKIASLENNIVVKVALTGKEVSQTVLGQQVRIVLQNDEVIGGVVSKISVVADPQNHLFTVEVLLPAIAFENGAIEGQLAEVIFDIEKKGLAYRIPIEALVAINIKGEALLMTELPLNNKIQQHAFAIIKVDNQSLYISADNENAIHIITRGWQQLTHDKSITSH